MELIILHQHLELNKIKLIEIRTKNIYTMYSKKLL